MRLLNYTVREITFFENDNEALFSLKINGKRSFLFFFCVFLILFIILEFFYLFPLLSKSIIDFGTFISLTIGFLILGSFLSWFGVLYLIYKNAQANKPFIYKIDKINKVFISSIQDINEPLSQIKSIGFLYDNLPLNLKYYLFLELTNGGKRNLSPYFSETEVKCLITKLKPIFEQLKS